MSKTELWVESSYSHNPACIDWLVCEDTKMLVCQWNGLDFFQCLYGFSNHESESSPSKLREGRFKSGLSVPLRFLILCLDSTGSSSPYLSIALVCQSLRSRQGIWHLCAEHSVFLKNCNLAVGFDPYRFRSYRNRQ